MAGLKKPTILRQSSYNSLYSNPLIDPKNCNNFSEKTTDLCINKNNHNLKESKILVKSMKLTKFGDDKENTVPNQAEFDAKCKSPRGKLQSYRNDRILKPPPPPSSSYSLQLCTQMNEPDSSFGFGFKVWDAAEETESAKSVNVWDFSDSEAAPLSSWSTLPNRALLCRTLPVDVGKCTCIIQKEAAPRGLGGGSMYSLFTNEGQGRQNRKLAVAYHKRRNGRSIFIIAQNTKGILSFSDDSFVGVVTSNLMGSKYYVWDQGRCPRRKVVKESKSIQAVVEFTPTICTWTGSYRSIKAWIQKKLPPLQLKNTNSQVQHMKGLPLDWNGSGAQLLLSKVPYHNKNTKQYELDFKEKVKAGLTIQSSVKNFQLTMEGNEHQILLQLGRIGKSKYVLDYRHPLTGYQAFCICLAAIDPKLCCTV
ncbi:hypothetical protein vseg_016152 [Gypsophila vaccaria]